MELHSCAHELFLFGGVLNFLVAVDVFSHVLLEILRFDCVLFLFFRGILKKIVRNL